MESLKLLQKYGLLLDAESYILTNTQKRELVNSFNKLQNEKNNTITRQIARMKNNRICLTSGEYTKFLGLLAKRNYKFTNPIVYRSSPPPSKRELNKKANNFIDDFVKILNQNPDSFIFTDLDIEYTKNIYLKHYIGMIYDPKNRTFEIFNSNDKIKFDEELHKLIELLDIIISQLKQKGVNVKIMDTSRLLNTEGSGHCAAWTIYYYYLRPNFENADEMMKDWRPKNIYQINKFIRNSNKTGL